MVKPAKGLKCNKARQNCETAWRSSSKHSFMKRFRSDCYGSQLTRHNRCARRMAQGHAKRCWKSWSVLWQTHCGPAKRLAGGATMSSWLSLTSQRARCWRITVRSWPGWREHRIFTGGATAYRSLPASERQKPHKVRRCPNFLNGLNPPCRRASMRAAITLRSRREDRHVCHRRNFCRLRCGNRRLLDGKGSHGCACAACGTADHRRRLHGHSAGGQSSAYPERDYVGIDRRARRLQVRQAALPQYLEDDVSILE